MVAALDGACAGCEQWRIRPRGCIAAARSLASSTLARGGGGSGSSRSSRLLLPEARLPTIVASDIATVEQHGFDLAARMAWCDGVAAHPPSFGGGVSDTFASCGTGRDGRRVRADSSRSGPPMNGGKGGGGSSVALAPSLHW